MATIDNKPSPSRTITMPDCLLPRWPFKRTLNPADYSVELESTKWTLSFTDLGPNLLSAAVDSHSTRLVALAYPDVPADHLRVLADWMTAFFIYDDLSDAMNREDAKKFGDHVMDVLRNPDAKQAEGLSDVLTDDYHTPILT